MIGWIKRRLLRSRAVALFNRAVFLQCPDLMIEDLRRKSGFFFLGYNKEQVWLRSGDNHLAYIEWKNIQLNAEILDHWQGQLDVWEDSFFHVDTLSRIQRVLTHTKGRFQDSLMAIFLSDRPDMVKVKVKDLQVGQVERLTHNSHCLWHYARHETTHRTKVYLPLAITLPEDNYLASSSASRDV